MSKAPWFPFYPHDFLSDPLVLLMTCEERGAYILLLCHAWDPPKWDGERAPLGSLPNDATLLAALSGCGQERWEEVAPHVLRPFKVSEDGRFLIQKRLTAEAEAMEQRRIAASEAGKRSAEAKAQRKANGKSTPVERSLNGGCDSVDVPFQRNSTNHSHSHSEAKEEAAPPGAGVRVSDILKRLDGQSGGAFVYSEPTKGQCIAIQRAAKKCGVVDWENLAAYLKANFAGRGGEPLGTPLLASCLADRVAKAKRWKAAGCPALTRVVESFEEARKRKIAEEEARRPDLQPFVPPVPNEN